MDKKLVVIGAGWLGDALALTAMDQGWQVQATHRHQGSKSYERTFVLNEQGQLEHNVSLEDAYWVCAMSPGMRMGPSNYFESVEQALALSHSMRAKGFVLCSSTGIYDTSSGEYDESSALALGTERQQRLHKAEQLAVSASAKVVRLGGLVGPHREPGRFVSGKALSSHGDDVVNMVHQQDAVNGILAILSNYERSDDIYNIVHPSHPKKSEYYRKHCQAQGTEEPSYTASDATQRLIHGSAIEQLGFNYQYDI
ncbi:NADP-binding protein [Pseudoalteromonas sp. SSDWG2]|uniref:NADP-binding protein n=1 Tax=Pseudoalteromonas sp. SSDWG2 TaxID=3139391 RepID=UPI003BACA950